jgi:hypothetical protein
MHGVSTSEGGVDYNNRCTFVDTDGDGRRDDRPNKG